MKKPPPNPPPRAWKDNDPRRLRMAEKRNDILQAARPVFLQEGWAGASLDRIAAESGIAKMTLYRHFGTKEELFEALVEDMCRHMKANAESAPLSRGRSVAERLTTEARGFVEALLQPDALALYRLVIAEGWRFPQLAQAFERSGTAVLRQRVSHILSDAGPASVSVAQRASGFINLALGDAYLEASLGLDDPNREARVKAQIAVAVRFALEGTEPASSRRRS